MIVKSGSTLSLPFTRHFALSTFVAVLESDFSHFLLVRRGPDTSFTSLLPRRPRGHPLPSVHSCGQKLGTGWGKVIHRLVPRWGETAGERSFPHRGGCPGTPHPPLRSCPPPVAPRFQGVPTGLIGQVSGAREGPDRSVGRADPSPWHPTPSHIPHTCGQGCGNTSV